MALRHKEVTRVEGFSDAVFAFALTLLVVSLEVPKSLDEMLNQLRGFLPFAAMFAMVCWIWYQHNVFFRRYGLQDAGTVALTCLLLFVVLFFVYPLKFVTMGGLGRVVGMRGVPDIGNGRLVMELYSSSVIAIFGTFVLMYLRAWRLRGDLELTATQEISLRASARSHILTLSVGVMSLALARFYPDDEVAPGIAGFTYLLIGPAQWWSGRRESRDQRRLRENARAPLASVSTTPQAEQPRDR